MGGEVAPQPGVIAAATPVVVIAPLMVKILPSRIIPVFTNVTAPTGITRVPLKME